MGLNLNKTEKRIEDLLARAGNETTPEEEARTSAVLAARKIREENRKGERDLHVIDVKEYDAVWQKELDDMRLKASFGGNQAQVAALQKELQAARQELESVVGLSWKSRQDLDAARRDLQAARDLASKAQQREVEARRQIDECQRTALKCSNELIEMKSKPAGADPGEIAKYRAKLEDLQISLFASRQDAKEASDLLKKAREAESEAKKAEAEAKRQIESCSNLVTRLKSETPTSPSSTELVQLKSQVKDLTFRSTAAQASARACANLREEELAYYERQRSKPLPAAQDPAYLIFAGLLAGGVITMVGAVVWRKITAPSVEPEATPAPAVPPAAPPTLPARTTRVPPRSVGHIAGK